MTHTLRSVTAHIRAHMTGNPSPSQTAAELAEEYGHWGSHPEYTVADWLLEVSNGDTRRSYWEWVAALIEFDGV